MQQHLVQGTEAWKNYRNNRVGSSDAAAILGISPWQTSWGLYMQKLGLIPDKKITPNMQYGIDNEEYARNSFCDKSGIKVYPTVVNSKKYHWMIASLDGVSKDGKTAIEIKWPNNEVYQMAVNGQVPKYYYCQIQHQIYCLELESMWYSCWQSKWCEEKNCYEKYGVDLFIERSETYIQNMIEKELEFWNGLQKLEPPQLSDRDYVEMHSERWENACDGYKKANEKFQEAEEDLGHWKQILMTLSEDKNAIGCGIKLQKIVRKGNVDYKAIPQLQEVDLDKFRKNNSIFWKVSEY